jgi:hypothetical protein
MDSLPNKLCSTSTSMLSAYFNKKSALIIIDHDCKIVGVGDNIFPLGTIIICGLKYALLGDRYDFRRPLGG